MSADFFSSIIGKPVVWGVDDCSAWAAGWYHLKTGNKPSLPEYSSKDEAHKLIEQAGGLVTLWGRALVGFGIERFGPAQSGDVGIIDTRKFGPVGGIFGAGGVFYLRSEDGYSMLSPRQKTILRVWQT